MTVQTPIFEKAGTRPPKASVRIEEIVGAGFDVQKFVENFEILASAPGGVERLRAMTLHLAIRGALTNELRVGPPASVTDGLVPPFDLPPGWAWREVKEVGDLKLGRQRAPSNHTGPHMRPYLRVANVHEARIDISHVLEMNFEPDEAERFLLVDGDVLLNEGQSYELVGRPAIYRGEVPGACFQNTLIRFRPWKQTVLSEFALVVFRAYMRTGRFRQEAQQTTNIAHLSAGRLAVIEFPLPPLAEQKRIVAKVDHLMALCDDLEARQTKKREIGTRLTKSALDALTTAEGPKEFDTAWKRVVENFDVLIDRAEKVGVLRRALLEGAVRGWLEPQVVSDEPVEKLWTRIHQERAALLGGKRRGGRGHGGAVAEPASAPYSVPRGWMWCQLGDVAGHIVDGTHHTPKYQEQGVAFISAKDIKGGKLVFDRCRYISAEEFEELAGRCCPKRGDVLVTKSGSIGEVAIVDTDRKFTLFESVALVPVVPSVDPRFVAHVAYLGASGQFGKDNQKGVGVTHLHLVDLRRVPFPLPPVAEQRRIVAKVEQLMKVCDDLEAKLRRAEDRAGKLVEAVVRELVA